MYWFRWTRKGTSQPTVTLLGRKENVLLAEHVLDFLSDQGERLWVRKKAELKLVASQKLSYKIGLIQGFREKLDLQEELRSKGTGASSSSALGSSSSQSALVSLNKKELEDFAAELFPSLAEYSGGTRGRRIAC